MVAIVGDKENSTRLEDGDDQKRVKTLLEDLVRE